MRLWLMASFLFLGFSVAPGFTQVKVAEGDYVMQGTSPDGGPVAKTASHWVLDENGRGRYRLSSEIAGQPKGFRVLQVEELEPNLAPTAIGYELYTNDEKTPHITVKCQFAGTIITCGEFIHKQVPSSSPFQASGPFWLWMEGLFALDIPWLSDGIANMAHLSEGSTVKVPTVNVLGGTAVLIGDAVNVAKLKEMQSGNQKLTVLAPDRPTQWEVYSDEESVLKMVDTQPSELNGEKLSVRHYTLSSGNGEPTEMWITDSGIMTRMSGVGEEESLTLTNYKQYKKLIPELPVAAQNKAP